MKKLILFTLLISFLVACSTATPTSYPTFTPAPVQKERVEILELSTYRTTLSDGPYLVIDAVVQNTGKVPQGPCDFSIMCKGFYSDGRLADVDERATKPDTLDPGEQGIFHSYLCEQKPGQSCCPKITRYHCEVVYYDFASCY